MTEESAPSEQGNPALSRRGLFGLAGAGVAGVGLGVGADRAVLAATATEASQTYPFYGKHQAGITTPAQDRLHFAAFDVSDIDRSELKSLLRDWTVAAARMTAGLPAGRFDPGGGPYDAPPDDTGEALGLPASSLTITFGFGPSLFDSRFGLESKRPAALVDLPHFPGDALEEERSGGDLCIQACSQDPQVAVHAIRNLSRIAFGRASLRWAQLGFGRTSSTSQSQSTPRNLFGFKDGTANLKAEETSELEEQLWAAAKDGPAWMSGGSYLVARTIRMRIETWDRTSLREQEQIFGRNKTDGAPLSGGEEFTEPDFETQGRADSPLIDPSSHVHLAHPSIHSGAKLLRRGYNFVDGNDELGRLNAGLFFLAYQRDPRKQFIPIQLSLARADLLNEYIQHIGSAIFAVPPGCREGSYIGSALFGD